MGSLPIRTTRTLKVTEVKISPENQAQLANLYQNAEYQALLDVMEQGCIELETAHLNTPLGDPEAILGGHAVAKAAWLFFTYVQKQVARAYSSQIDRDEAGEPASLNDLLQGVE